MSKKYPSCIVCGWSKDAVEFEEGFFHTPENNPDGLSKRDCRGRYEKVVAELRPRYGFNTGESWEKYLEDHPDFNPVTYAGNGWIGIIVNLTEALLLQHPDLHVSQIKEKFGGLRYYTNGLNDLGHTLVRWAEGASYRTCEVCGEYGEVRKGGWLKTLCDEHHEENQKWRERVVDPVTIKEVMATRGDGNVDQPA